MTALLPPGDLAVLVAQRLVAPLDVDDAEASRAEGHPRPLNEAIVIGPAVTDDGRHALENHLIQRSPGESFDGESAGNPAHA